MRRNLIISLLSALFLICSVKGIGSVHVNSPKDYTKAKTSEASLSIAFSLSGTEIEVISFHSIAPAFPTVEKRESFHWFLSAYHAAHNSHLRIPVSREVLAVIAANDYRLLFPFHHFW